jgi:nicotinamidase-related amidase
METLKIIPEKTAFISIDLQKGITSREMQPNKSNDVIKNAAKIAEVARANGIFVVLVNVTPFDGKDSLNPIVDNKPSWGNMTRSDDWSEIVPEMNPQKNDLKITKRQWGAFHGTELDLQLRRRGIDTIILCGISTNIGVETTAREAYQHGYNQIIAIDACTAMTEEEHINSEKHTFSRIARIRKTEDIVNAIMNKTPI